MPDPEVASAIRVLERHGITPYSLRKKLVSVLATSIARTSWWEVRDSRIDNPNPWRDCRPTSQYFCRLCGGESSPFRFYSGLALQTNPEYVHQGNPEPERIKHSPGCYYIALKELYDLLED